MARRRIGNLANLLLALVFWVSPGGAAAAAFDFDDVTAAARALALRSYQDPRGHVPSWLLSLSFDAWRDIRFRPDRALWRGTGAPFQVQLFHPGLFYDRAVVVNIVDAEGVHPLPFDRGAFDYGASAFADRVPPDLGWAGFRLHHPLNTSDYFDEVIAFLGASYFRAVARGQGYGLSARGLAIDTALSSGEEFPYFREFWLVRPAPGQDEMTVHALLDSPRATGAYRFVVRPGAETRVRVDARLFRRESVEKLGIAPLTSMFFHGENTTRAFSDYRPEVHDSDGLLVADGSGEWIWRPLDNPRRLDVTSFAVKDPRGFGLLQRDRSFDHYQDLGARPDQRPSAWVSPRGAWGKGRIELVRIPTDDETNDNVVAYFVPDSVPEEEPRTFGYDISWYHDDPGRPPTGRCVATRRDAGTLEGAQRFVLDFSGGPLSRLPADAPVEGVVSVGEGQLLEQQVLRNPQLPGWRLVFQLRPGDDAPGELRAFLALEGKALTETWSLASP